MNRAIMKRRTMNICPISIPRLKAKSGSRIFELNIMTLKLEAKANPWISPKPKAIPYLTFR